MWKSQEQITEREKLQIKIVCVESRKRRSLKMKGKTFLASSGCFQQKQKQRVFSECLLLGFACWLYSAHGIFLNKGVLIKCIYHVL